MPTPLGRFSTLGQEPDEANARKAARDAWADAFPAEIWARLSFAPDYAVSDHGRVRRLIASNGYPAGRLLRPYPTGLGGHLEVNIRTAGGLRKWKVHRLVAVTFLGPAPSSRHMVAHGDGRVWNNRLSNLRWATNGENQADRLLHGTDNGGERNAKAKLTDRQVEEIRAASGTHAAIAARFGIVRQTVGGIKSGRYRPRPTSGPSRRVEPRGMSHAIRS